MPWYLPKELELYCQKLEATKMFSSRRMDKQTVKHPDNGVLPALKQWAVKPWEDKKEACMRFFTWKKLTWKDCVYCMILTQWYSRKDHGHREKMSDCTGLGAVEVSVVGRAQQTVRAAKAFRVIPHLCPNPEQVRHQEGALRCELWTLDDVSVCWSQYSNTLLRMLIMGEAVHVLGARVVWLL